MARKEPGTGGQEKYYRIVLTPKSRYKTFRTHDVGRAGHTQRIAGLTKSGEWETHTWLIRKDDAYVSGGALKSKNPKIQHVLDQLPGKETRVKKSVFKGKPRIAKSRRKRNRNDTGRTK